MMYNGGPGCCDYWGPVAAMMDDVAQVIRYEQRCMVSVWEVEG